MYLNEISSQGSSEVWFDCDSGKIIPGEVSQSFTATVDGSYAVIVTDSGCVDTSSCYAIVVTGIRKKNKDPFFTISPNPTQGRVTVKSSSGIDKIEIYSVLGELIYKTYGSLHIAEIDISDQPDGVYFLNVVSDDKKQSVKIIKQE